MPKSIPGLGTGHDARGQTVTLSDGLPPQHQPIRSAAGHSPGRVTVNAKPGGAGAVFMGDVIHHPIQQVRPDLPFFADENPVAACATRLRLLAQCADDDAVLYPTHFPDPPAGRVRRTQRHFSHDFL